jgi:hypothetical protein
MVLSALRLLKPLPALRPSARTLGVLGLAISCLVPLALLAVAPGLGLASTEATLLYWRDGLPSTYEPLAPIAAFGAHAPGLPLLAADVSRLCGLAPYRTVLLVALAGAGLVVVAVFTLFDRWGRARAGFLAAAFLAAAWVLVPALLALGPLLLASAFGLAALGVLVKGSGRAPAVASAFFLASALTVDALAGVAGLAAVAALADPSRRRLALLLGISLALPRLVELRAFSRAEFRAAVEEAFVALDPRADRAPEPREAPDAATLRAMAWLRSQTGPLDAVCVSPLGHGAFVPAVAGRAVVPTQAPAVYREEEAAGARRGCRFFLTIGSSDPAGPPPVPAGVPPVPSWSLVFTEGRARVFEAASIDPAVTSFDKVPGNRAPLPP